MNDLYTIFGEFVRNKNIENFADIDEETETVDVADRIQEITSRMTSGEIKEEEIKKEITILQKLNDDGKLSKEDEVLFQKLIKDNVRLTDGINLVGNLELGGIIKARGFHLSDGTKINTVTKTIDKLAVPLDKDGNIHIKPASGKKMKIDKSDIKHLNIPKDGRLTFGEGEDGDLSHLRKVANKDDKHLRLTLNDNTNESLQIWGNSCKTDKCEPDGGTVTHVFDSEGNALHYGDLQVKNPKNKTNPTGEPTHFNYKKEGNNYIRGSTEIKGDTTVLGKLCVYEPGQKVPICIDSKMASGSTVNAKSINIEGNTNLKGDIVFNGGNNWIMHTPDDKRHTLYIAPSETLGKGDWNWSKQTQFLSNGEVILNEGKHAKYNPTGWPTHFNAAGNGLNYIRGQTEMRGEVNFVDSTKGINITNAKNANNTSGGGTHFNYTGQGLNYIRGKTEMRGEVNFVDSTKSVTISNGKNANNPTGELTRFNHGGASENHIIGSNYIKGETNFVDTTKGVNISNPKNANNTNGETTHFNYGGKGLNYIRGSTEIKGTHVDINTNTGLKVHGHGKVSTFGSLNSGWCHLTTSADMFYMNKGLQVNGPISTYNNKPILANYGVQSTNGLTVTGGRTWIKDAENKGRLRVGAVWGIPGLYSEDNQDIVIGVPSAKKVNLGTAGKFVEITGTGNMKVPGDVNTPLLSRIGGDWLRINQQGNSVGRVATYGGFSINETRANHGGLSVGSWEPPGLGNIKATGQITGKELLAEGNIKAVGQVRGKDLLAESKICINNTCITEEDLKKMIPVSYKFTNTTIKTGVAEWISNPTAATAKYGHIKDWDTSAVTDMTSLFQNRSYFNDDISKWNVSNVKNMAYMFTSAASFNQPIGNWNVSNVINMYQMFNSAKVFNQPISNWNVSNVTNMFAMFHLAFAFNQPIGNWNVSNVTDMYAMFYAARAFNQDITGWNAKKVTNFGVMFDGATLMLGRGAPGSPSKSYFKG